VCFGTLTGPGGKEREGRLTKDNKLHCKDSRGTPRKKERKKEKRFS
jgi:hypothetical protein